MQLERMTFKNDNEGCSCMHRATQHGDFSLMRRFLDLITTLAQRRAEPAPDPSETLRIAIVEEAHKEWLDPTPIVDLKREVGWRTGKDDDEWCGIGAGACMLRAGVAYEICAKIMPSTYRLNSVAPGDVGWSQVPFDQPERVPTGDVRPGDVITVTTSRGLPYGDHIAIVYAVIGNLIYTYEANAKGILPSGAESNVRAFVRQVRTLDSVRRIWRFGAEHRSAA